MKKNKVERAKVKPEANTLQQKVEQEITPVQAVSPTDQIKNAHLMSEKPPIADELQCKQELALQIIFVKRRIAEKTKKLQEKQAQELVKKELTAHGRTIEEKKQAHEPKVKDEKKTTESFNAPADATFERQVAVHTVYYIKSAKSKSTEDILAVLRKINNFDIYQIDPDENLPLLHAAVMNGMKSLVNALIQYVDADSLATWINHKDASGTTAFQRACAKGDINIIDTINDALNRAGASLVISDNYGRTALHHAVTSNQVQVIEYLHKQAPELLYKSDHAGYTPLLLSLTLFGRFSGEKVVDMLLLKYDRIPSEKVLNTDTQHPGATALHLAVYYKAGQLKALLQKCIPVDEQDAKGRTAIQLAVDVGNDVAVTVLTHFKADPDATDHRGESPRRRAQHLRRGSITSMLEESKTPPTTTQTLKPAELPDCNCAICSRCGYRRLDKCSREKNNGGSEN